MHTRRQLAQAASCRLQSYFLSSDAPSVPQVIRLYRGTCTLITTMKVSACVHVTWHVQGGVDQSLYRFAVAATGTLTATPNAPCGSLLRGSVDVLRSLMILPPAELLLRPLHCMMAFQLDGALIPVQEPVQLHPQLGSGARWFEVFGVKGFAHLIIENTVAGCSRWVPSVDDLCGPDDAGFAPGLLVVSLQSNTQSHQCPSSTAHPSVAGQHTVQHSCFQGCSRATGCQPQQSRNHKHFLHVAAPKVKCWYDTGEPLGVASHLAEKSAPCRTPAGSGIEQALSIDCIRRASACTNTISPAKTSSHGTQCARLPSLAYDPKVGSPSACCGCHSTERAQPSSAQSCRPSTQAACAAAGRLAPSAPHSTTPGCSASACKQQHNASADGLTAAVHKVTPTWDPAGVSLHLALPDYLADTCRGVRLEVGGVLLTAELTAQLRLEVSPADYKVSLPLSLKHLVYGGQLLPCKAIVIQGDHLRPDGTSWHLVLCVRWPTASLEHKVRYRQLAVNTGWCTV
jgi:hypothetical protein